MSKILPFLKSLLQNKGVKLLALVLAVVSWYAIRGAISFETMVNNVPVIIQLGDGWAVLDRSTDVVDIVFQGARADLLRLNRENVKVILNMQGRERTGSLVFELESSMVAAPGSARARVIQPSEVMVKLDRQSTRQIPVKVDVQGAPPDGFEMGLAVSDPASVEVSGPKLRVDRLKWVRTAVVPLAGRRQSFRERVELVVPGETWEASIEPPRVNARVTISERSEQRLFKGIRVDALIDPKLEGVSVAVAPVTVDVTIKGVSGRLQDMKKAEVRSYVDCSTLTVGSRYELPVRVYLPEGVSLDHIAPQSVHVEVSPN